MSEPIAIIGGTGLTSLEALAITRRQVVSTPYGEPSGPLVHGTVCGRPVVFIPRHGHAHNIPPHKVNYRANMWALKQIGAEKVIAVAAVGGIAAQMSPATLAIPDQIVDYTWSRNHTFFEEDLTQVTHIDFTFPYDMALRGRLLEAAGRAGLEVQERATYGATQGPRLETAAEILRMERDGCDLVGMTGMPEAALARELGLAYAACAVVANRAAGKAGETVIRLEEIERNLVVGMERVARLLAAAVPML